MKGRHERELKGQQGALGGRRRARKKPSRRRKTEQRAEPGPETKDTELLGTDSAFLIVARWTDLCDTQPPVHPPALGGRQTLSMATPMSWLGPALQAAPATVSGTLALVPLSAGTMETRSQCFLSLDSAPSHQQISAHASHLGSGAASPGKPAPAPTLPQMPLRHLLPAPEMLLRGPYHGCS